MEEYKCRTCLGVTEGQICTQITENCVDKSIKQSIIQLVPEMRSTLMDSEVVCNNCLKTLRSCMKFINRCLKIEIDIQENISKQLDALNNVEYNDNHLKMNISLDHDYFGETENASLDEDSNKDIKELKDFELGEDFKIEIVDDDIDSISSLKEYSQKSESNDTTQDDEENCLNEERDENFLDDDQDENYVDEDQDENFLDGDQEENYVDEDQDENSLDEDQDENFLDEDQDEEYVDGNQDEHFLDEDQDENYVDGDQDENYLQENFTFHECETCKETFTDKDSLKKHEKIHNLICKTCSQSFPTKKELITHQRSHAPFECDKCGKTFIAESHRIRHQSVHTRKEHICEICGKIFPTSSALRYHQISHRQERLFMCDKCPRRYKSRVNLKRHVQQYHEKVDQYQCPKCGILVGGRQTYSKHYRLVHLQLKPFVCDVCGREFGRKDYLQKHMYYHTGEPRPVQHRNKIKSRNGRGKPPKFGIRLRDPGTPVNCKICGKLILSVHLLKSHLQSHVKIKRHKCSYCELTFTLSNNRDRHQRIHEADPEKKFRCNICWKKMTTEEELEKHLVGHYNRPPQHSCDICGEKFHRKYLLDNHHLDKHTDPGDIERAEKEIVIDNLLEYAHPNDIYELYDTKE